MWRVLLIGPSFFGYSERLAHEFSCRGIETEYANDRPTESVAFKSIAKFSNKLIDGEIGHYANELVERPRSKRYGRVINIGGMTFCFTREQMERLRASTDATFVCYLWDSLENSPRLSASFDVFDHVLSFDPTDCDCYGFDFRPLFYLHEHESVPRLEDVTPEFDACFVGSVHQPSKFEAVMRMCKMLTDAGLSMKTHLYMPSRSAELLRKAQYTSYRGVEFSHRSLSTHEKVDLYARSKSIIDVLRRDNVG